MAVCPKCGVNFLHKSSLVRHRINKYSCIYPFDLNIICDNCDIEFDSLSELICHKKTICERIIVSRHTCDKCNNEFQYLWELMRHKKRYKSCRNGDESFVDNENYNDNDILQGRAMIARYLEKCEN